MTEHTTDCIHFDLVLVSIFIATVLCYWPELSVKQTMRAGKYLMKKKPSCQPHFIFLHLNFCLQSETSQNSTQDLAVL